MNSKLPSTVAEDTVWLYEQGTGSILQYVPAEKDCNLHVELRHLQFRDNHPLAIEEYAVRVEKLVVGTLDPFVTFYQFVHQKGDVWRAEVERCSINPVPWRGEGPRYTRRMSSYDFDEFFKDMTIIEESHLSDEAKKNRFVIH